MAEKKSVTFIAPGPIKWASTRLRSVYPSEELKLLGFESSWHVGFDTAPVADTYVFNKVINKDFMEQVKELDRKIILDFCDPVWWFNPNEVLNVIPLADTITFSSRQAKDDFMLWYLTQSYNRVPSVGYIPDCVYPPEKKAEMIDKKFLRLIWFGASQNRSGFQSVLPDLYRLHAHDFRFSVTIFDDQPGQTMSGFPFPIYHANWSLETETPILTEHDIAVVPDYPGRWGTIKSNNRRWTANLHGLPVMTGTEDIEHLFNLFSSADFRQSKVDQHLGDWLHPTHIVKDVWRTVIS